MTCWGCWLRYWVWYDVGAGLLALHWLEEPHAAASVPAGMRCCYVCTETAPVRRRAPGDGEYTRPNLFTLPAQSTSDDEQQRQRQMGEQHTVCWSAATLYQQSVKRSSAGQSPNNAAETVPVSHETSAPSTSRRAEPVSEGRTDGTELGPSVGRFLDMARSEHAPPHDQSGCAHLRQDLHAGSKLRCQLLRI
jgi:hypothetical protein